MGSNNNKTNIQTEKYLFGDMLGRGKFGLVFKCTDKKNGTPRAIKIQTIENGKREVRMMQLIQNLDKHNVIKFYETFQDDPHVHIVLELLDESLDTFLKKNRCLTLIQIRPILKQILVALKALNEVGIIHTDIKPSNIMLVNHENQPFRVKLIDFGVALLKSDVKAGIQVQPPCLRAPEVILGLKFTEAIDMWSLGLTSACLLLGHHLYRVRYDYDLLQGILYSCGTLPADMLNKGLYTKKFFKKHRDVWRLKTPSEYSGNIVGDKLKNPFIKLEKIKQLYITENDSERQDLNEFLDLLDKMLQTDHRKRITPTEALQHNFLTMEHLDEGCDYTKKAFLTMKFSTPNDGKPVDTDSCDGAQVTGLARIPTFFSSVFTTILKPLRMIQYFCIRNLCRCPIEGSGTRQATYPFHGTSGRDPERDGYMAGNHRDTVDTSQSGRVPNSCFRSNLFPADTRDGLGEKLWRNIKNFSSTMFRMLYNPLKKIRNYFLAGL
ncbi:homeodomain-interacting protein kinase 2-like [Thalassophryne amazonica]|uniref:homeodomain-interacting protein kinase 2-like n=1 Tax=Thalassophryne amazonica TaxID=390379 RepID=UPI001471C29D|nr:homeodomain-interacting protein kinase 2-like [Thalassophryne amazonica]